MPIPPAPKVAWLPVASHAPSTPLHSALTPENGNCQLLGGVGLLVQGLMGVLVIATLLVKRGVENPRRPWKIWALDNSKQFLGQAIVHTSNILISTFPAPAPSPHDPLPPSDSRSSFIPTTRPPPTPSLPPNPCSLYFLNVLIDTTLGVVLIAYLLKLSRWVLVEKLEWEGWEMGVYKEGKRWNNWSKQAGIFVSCLLIMKGSVVLIFAVLPGLFGFGSWFLSWLDPHGQVVFVMAIFPLAMNILQFTLLDTILKHRSPPPHSSLLPSTPSSPTPASPSLSAHRGRIGYASLPANDTAPPSPTASVSALERGGQGGMESPLLRSPRPGVLRQRSGSGVSIGPGYEDRMGEEGGLGLDRRGSAVVLAGDGVEAGKGE